MIGPLPRGESCGVVYSLPFAQPTLPCLAYLADISGVFAGNWLYAGDLLKNHTENPAFLNVADHFRHGVRAERHQIGIGRLLPH
jgi:hypothetical protein